MDLNITGTAVTPQLKSSKISQSKKSNQPLKRADIHVSKVKHYDVGPNQNMGFQNLEVKGSKFNKDQKPQKSDIKPMDILNNNSDVKQNNSSKNSPMKQSQQIQSNQQITDNYQTMNDAGFNEEDIMNIYGNPQVPPVQVQQEDLEYNLSQFKLAKSQNVSNMNQQEVKESVVFSGGFKIPDVSLEKRQDRIRNMQPQKKQVELTEEEKNKRKIMQQMGIMDQDVDEYFDVMDERVYEKEQDDQVHQILEDKVDYRIQGVQHQREQLLRRKAELEMEKERVIRERQIKLDRLYGKKSNYNNFMIDEQEYEESGQLPNNESLEQQQNVKKSMNSSQLIDRLNQNTSNIQQQNQSITNQYKSYGDNNGDTMYSSFNKQQQQQDLNKTNDQDVEQQLEDDIFQGEEDDDKYDDMKIHNFIHERKPDFQQTEDVLTEHRSRMKELEEMYKNRKQIQEDYDEEQRKVQEKIQKGIMRAPISQAEKEQRQFEDEFKQFVKGRKKIDERKKMAQTVEKKEFDLFQSTSPNPLGMMKQTKAAYRENISTLYPEDIQRDLRKQAREQQQSMGNQHMDTISMNNDSQNLNAINLSQSKQFNNNSSYSPQKTQQNNLQQSRDSEMLMLQTLFDKLDRGNKGKIEKIAFQKELFQNEEIMNMYNLDKKSLNKELQNFNSNSPLQLTLHEMVKFLKQERKQKKIVKNENYFAKEIRKNKQQQKQETEKNSLGNCLLTQEQVNIMKQIFDKVDKNQDWVVKRSVLIEKLREDVRVVRLLHLPAVYLANIDKQLTTDRVLYRIEKEEFIGDQNERKNKEFITWTQYLEYFTDSQNINKKSDNQQKEDNLKSKQMKLYSQMKNQMDDQDMIEVDEKLYTILQDAFDQTEKHSDIYVNTTYFIQNVKLHKQYPNISGTQGRVKAQDFDLQDELICQVIDRIEEEGEEFMELDEIKEFFTRRGRPKGYYEKLNRNQKKYKQVSQAPSLMKNEDELFEQSRIQRQQKQFKKSGQNFKNNTNNNQEFFNSSGENIDDREFIDGYDSDPETYQYSHLYQPRKPDQKQSKMKRSVTNSNFNKDIAFSRYEDFNNTGQISMTTSHNMQTAKKSVGFNLEKSGSQTQKLSHYGIDQHTSEEEDEHQYEQNQNQYYNQDQERIYSGSNLDSQRIGFKEYGTQKPPLQKSQSQLQSKGKLQSSKDQFRITKPEPYQFDEREKLRKQTRSISQRKFQEMLDEKKQKEHEIYNKSFKAKPVPAHVNQDLFKKIIHDQEQRRQEVRANSIAITISREKPFSFYKRDLENKEAKAKKKSKYDREQFVFKANKVPWFCSVRLFDRINNEEKLKRQERVAKEAQRIMQMSKLPERMEMHEQQKKAQQMRDQIGINQYGTMHDDFNTNGEFGQTKNNQNNQDLSFQPPKAKPIPNFDKLQKNFQDSLDRRRKNKRVTEPQPFNFQETRKAPTREYLDVENQLMKTQKEKPKVDKIEEARKIANQEPAYMPPSTKKFEQYVEKQKKLKEEKQKQEEEKEKLKKRRELKTQKFAEKFRNSAAVKKADADRKKQNEEKLKAKQEEMKQQAKEWKEKKRNIIKKANQEPLLLERPPLREKELAKLKALNRMYKIMVNNKTSQKDMKEYFTKEELQQIEDLKYMKKRYPKYFEEIEGEESQAGKVSDGDADSGYGDDFEN